jgi:Zn-dependent protease with chaperone function
MNFFAQQERARSHTRRMLILFVLAVVAIVVAVDVVLMVTFGAIGHDKHQRLDFGSLQPQVMLWSSVGVLLVIGLATAFKVATLRAGGGAVARQFGATLIDSDTTNPAYRRLRNVIEEIAIASGVPVPEIYVLEDEAAINAFAAGYTPADAAVTVTRGCIERLNRDELQGVIAHEFSHVLNGDMRLNIRLMGVLFGILVIGIAGRKLIENTGRSRDSGSIVAFGFAILAIGYIGVFFGRLIKAGISRQREYLADASAVQFTRQTLGIGGALKKIGALAEGSKLGSAETEEVAHMLFCDGVGYGALFATHPPLVQRITLLDPQFKPTEFVEIAQRFARQPAGAAEAEAADEAAKPAHGSLGDLMPGIGGRLKQGIAIAVGAAAAGALPSANAEVTLTPKKVATQVAHPGSDDYRTAATISTAISEKLRTFAYTAERATQVIYALTLDEDAAVREKQLRIVEKFHDPATRAGVEEIFTEVRALHPMQRLPLAQLTFPCLRRRPRPQLQSFLIVLNQLIQADGRVQLAEYCLARLITVQVIDALDPSKSRPTGSLKLTACANELADVFTIIAEYGNDSADDAQRAYLLGMHEVVPDAIREFAECKEWAIALDRALPKLDQVTPAGKELIVRGLTRAIGADGKVTVTEAELLRTICATLHCPLPPQLDQVAA